jgi:hypothetical protein
MSRALANTTSKKTQPKFSPSTPLYAAAIVTALLASGGCGPKESEPPPNPKTSNPTSSTPTSNPQPAPPKQPDNEAAALQRVIEQVLKCSDAPQPKTIVRSLHQAGFIQLDKNEWTESATYFPTLKPIEVWGMKVAYVFGYDNDRKIFSRGPGTAPPTHFGIVVPYSVENAQKRIPSGSTPSNITSSSVEMNWPQPSKVVLTDIECAQ